MLRLHIFARELRVKGKDQIIILVVTDEYHKAPLLY